MLIKLAWRNIWRNKRRTAITLVMIQFAVVLATIMATLREGIMDAQVQSVVGGYQGFAAVQDTAYLQKPFIDFTTPYNDSVRTALSKMDGVQAFAPRIVGAGMVTCGEKFKIGRVIGIDPKMEEAVTGLNSSIIKGRGLQNLGEIILGESFAERLHADLDSLVFISGMGYQGNSANIMAKVVGIVKMNNVQEDKRMAFVQLQDAQEGFALYEGVNQIVISFNNNDEAQLITEKLKSNYKGKSSSIHSWDEINTALFMMVEVNDAANVIVSAMLYFIISFGLFGTILMMLAERKKEFGMLVAIGMKKKKLAYIVYLENTFLAITGTVLGFLIAIPVVYYFNQNPIEIGASGGSEFGKEVAKDLKKYGFQPLVITSMNIKIFIGQALAVLGMSLFFSIYPILKIRSMNENKAMRS